MLAIRRMECSRKFIEHNFVLNEYTDSIGRKLPAYRITRDGFVFLAMGFTGKEAAAWKEAYITAFNQMEAEPNGYSVFTFMPLYEEICKQLGHSGRYIEQMPELLADPGFEVSDALLSKLHLATCQRLMQRLAAAKEGMDMLETTIRRIKGKPAVRALAA